MVAWSKGVTVCCLGRHKSGAGLLFRRVIGVGGKGGYYSGAIGSRYYVKRGWRGGHVVFSVWRGGVLCGVSGGGVFGGGRTGVWGVAGVCGVVVLWGAMGGHVGLG